MSLTILKPFISSEEYEFSGSQEEFEELCSRFDDLWDDFPDDLLFSVEAAHDSADDRIVFRDVQFRVASRYKIDGDRYFSGGGFAVNIDDTLRLIKSRQVEA